MAILSDATGMVEYSTASAMAEAFERCIQQQRAAIAELRAADEEIRTVIGNGRWGFSPTLQYRGRDYSLEPDSVENLLWSYNLTAWESIVEKIGLRKVLSSADQKKLEEALDTHRIKPPGHPDAMPWLTAEAIQDVLRGWLGALDDFLTELVREEYDFWKPHRERGYKSDQFAKLGERVIATYMLTHHRHFDVCYRSLKHVISLDNIFHLLDGAGPLPGHNGPLVDAIKVCSVTEKRGETNYFEFKCYLNGNLHLRFKRLDLLDKFNALAGRDYLGEAKHKGNADDGSATRSLSTLQG